MSSGPDRVYDDGRREWRQDVGGGWTKWSDDRGNSGFEKDLGGGRSQRGNDYQRDYGNQIRHSDGSWEPKWDK